MPVEAVHAQLRAMTHRRCIKTHTPATGIPWYDDAKYIHVARDGRDAFMSMCNHMERMSAAAKAGLNETIANDPDVARLPDWTGDVHGFFQVWLNGMHVLENIGTYWARARQQNVLLVHFNDLKADLDGEMRRIAKFLDIEVPPELWEQTVQRCTFEAMRNDEARMGTFDVFDGGLKGFIFKGTNGRWKDVLTADELAQYETKLNSVLSPEAAAWVTHGRAKLTGAANP
jgi:aryl sulfotransferase